MREAVSVCWDSEGGRQNRGFEVAGGLSCMHEGWDCCTTHFEVAGEDCMGEVVVAELDMDWVVEVYCCRRVGRCPQKAAGLRSMFDGVGY